MAESSSKETATPSAPIQLQPQSISFKLTDDNYLIWRQQILTTVRGLGLEHYLVGTEIPPQFLQSENEKVLNPAYLGWNRQDQLLSAWIQSSLTESVMVLVVGLDSSREVWNALETNFSSHSKAKVMQHKLQLQTMKKDSLSMKDYLNKIKICCDQLGAAGCRVLVEDQILHILAGLGPEYDSVMVNITSKGDTWSIADVSALLLSFETRLEYSKSVATVNMDGSQPSANMVQSSGPRRDTGRQHHRSGFHGQQGYHRGGFGGRNSRGGRGGRGGRSYGNKLICQVCQKPGHGADRCWYRFEHTFAPQAPQSFVRQQQPQHSFHSNPAANVVQAGGNHGYQAPYIPTSNQSEYGFDGRSTASWYPDSGATNHISNDLSNLNSSSEYNGGNSLQMGNDCSVKISHIGQSTFIASNSRPLILKDLLYVPQITKNLLSVSQFARDNNVFFEFHPQFCFVKDLATKISSSGAALIVGSIVFSFTRILPLQSRLNVNLFRFPPTIRPPLQYVQLL